MARGDRNKDKQTRCRILFDSGSQRSYITQKIAKKLNLSIEKDENLSVYTFGSRSPREFNSPVVQLELETKSKKGKIIYANIVPMISQSVPYAEELNNWKHKVELADDGSLTDQVDILIGNDYYYSFLHSEKIRISEDLYLVDSEFGWILSGQGPRRDIEEQHMSVITYFQTEIDFKFNKPDMPLDQGSIAFLWELESIGITDSPKITREEEAIHKFNETTKLINNRYHVSWPWNEYPPSLTPNYGLAYGRLVNLVKRLDKETLKSYNDAIQEQISKGIVEEVLDKTRVEHPVHYLPHHCVAQKNKPIRIVYDASSKIKSNKSLNECLYCGPLMLEDLTCILIRFRSHNIALSADVEKAFLQIGLHEKDCDVTRFIWLKDVEKPPHVDNIICLRIPDGVEEKVVKILGLDWNLKHDTLHVKFTLTTEAYSKREVLKLNPADIATRPMSSNEDKERWLTGPQFLSESDKQKTPVKYMSQSFFLSTREGLPNTSKEKDSNLELQNNFLGESIRAKEDSRTSYKESLCITETIKKLQAEYFTQEVAGKETDLSRNLKLFKDVDGLLRCKGRLQNAELSFDKRYPILIPKECDFTNNLIKKVHNDNYHIVN
ncbi:uncharacterized protein LOC123872613 [Maniola jurtina]|uniref:uncharacterized protein LOC123872613 n=1 Tax=Maniola jurtina TaxID=191418 RepID=UPI001E68F3E5|nr:uncharacterized protein LOC123872613 [Maniola jurtina]